MSQQQEAFQLWLEGEYQKKNNSIITDDTFQEIIHCLQTGSGNK